MCHPSMRLYRLSYGSAQTPGRSFVQRPLLSLAPRPEPLPEARLPVVDDVKWRGRMNWHGKEATFAVPGQAPFRDRAWNAEQSPRLAGSKDRLVADVDRPYRNLPRPGQQTPPPAGPRE